MIEKSKESNQLKSQISSSHKAAESISKMLSQMGHGHIKLRYNDEEQAYALKRGGNMAKRLSEGEKTAIAFAHFMASLEEAKFKLDESIVVIDDPISSLDSTACYFVYGLIKSLESRVNQLFLLTHSYSFFLLLLRDFRSKKHGHYEVHRVVPEGSEVGYSKIIKMEEERLKYFSEYNYLFSQIYQSSIKIKAGENIGFEKLYTLMNCSRKLIEGFLGFKYPKDKLDDKWKNVMEDHSLDTAMQQAIVKVVNFGSHSGIDSLFSGTGLDSEEMAECVNLVLDFIRDVDPKHYEGMENCEPDSSNSEAILAAAS